MTRIFCPGICGYAQARLYVSPLSENTGDFGKHFAYIKEVIKSVA